ncbi:hypothetical protein [Cerasicoccus frondis]|uniref:hypothetical protein n=1 Tax=Cerasicoccus frondis TaxID=490090 RepID=UPI0028524D7D|nr:hypothetical protein [Cerasicoccus frondis]
MSSLRPTWNREAIDRGLHFIVLFYEKADGFVFCPSNLDKPFRVGGDYDGNWPVAAEHGCEYLQMRLNQHFRERVEWFIPFSEKVVAGVDFSLDDLPLAEHSVRLVHGEWPW